tara:strand:+ start:49 stop:261 length:213 start_codon:yes stop_codon:yes gene_type:complete
MFDDKIKKLKELRFNIENIMNRIEEENQSLQSLTKEYLGEEMSEDILRKIIKQETNKELIDKLGVILFGE